MHVFINEKEITPGAAAGATIAEVVEASRMHVDPSEIVTTVALDGVEFSAGEEERFGRRQATSVERVVITTRTPTAFAAEKRKSLAATLDEVAERTRMVVGLLQRSETRAANGLLACLMEELRLTLVLDYQLTLLAADEPSGAREAVAEIAPQLLDAEERKAWNVLAGLLEQKLVPVLQEWAIRTRARVAA
jgi:hypothetical protein